MTKDLKIDSDHQKSWYNHNKSTKIFDPHYNYNRSASQIIFLSFEKLEHLIQA